MTHKEWGHVVESTGRKKNGGGPKWCGGVVNVGQAVLAWGLTVLYRGKADTGRDPAVWHEIWRGPGGQPGGTLEEGPGGPPSQSGDGEAQGCREDRDGTPGGRLDAITPKDSGKDSGGGVCGFADYPVIDGGVRAMDQAEEDLGDQILVVQGPDRRRSKREVPDTSMWGSCFTLFKRAVLLADPPQLSAYRETIQKSARTHQCDFVLRYDRQFRKAAAWDRSRFWARVDSSLFMQELAGPQAAYLASGIRVPQGGGGGTGQLPGKK